MEMAIPGGEAQRRAGSGWGSNSPKGNTLTPSVRQRGWGKVPGFGEKAGAFFLRIRKAFADHFMTETG